jgi:transposase-like protein
VSKKYVNESIVCKYCELNTVSKCGSYNGIQRYFCKSCGHKFKTDSNAFYSKVPSEIISTALNMFYKGNRTCEIIRSLKQEYQFSSSRGLVYQWINKYSTTVPEFFKDLHPDTGNLWLVSRTFFHRNNIVYKMTDIVDAVTRFLLATSMNEKHDIVIMRQIMEEAVEKAGKYPRSVWCHMHYSYFQNIKKAFDCDAEHIHNRLSAREYNVEMVDIVDRIFKPRIKVMRNLKSIDKIKTFVDGWKAHYNFILPQAELDNKTPAQAAGIEYNDKTWKGVCEKNTREIAYLFE